MKKLNNSIDANKINKLNRAKKEFIADLRAVTGSNSEAVIECFDHNCKKMKLKNIFDKNKNVKKKYLDWINKQTQNLNEANHFLDNL